MTKPVVNHPVPVSVPVPVPVPVPVAVDVAVDLAWGVLQVLGLLDRYRDALGGFLPLPASKGVGETEQVDASKWCQSAV